MRRSALALSLLLVAAACGEAAPPTGSPDAPPADSGAPPDGEPPGPALRIDFLEPDHGPFGGGTEVLVRGRGFAEGMRVTFDGRAVEPLDVAVIDDRRVVVRTPPGAPGLADVAVEVDGVEASAPGAYRYEAITVEPRTGAVAGGTWVVVRGFGTSFQAGDQVTFGGSPLADVTVAGALELGGATPPGVPGRVDVTVSGAWGSVTAADAFTYLDSTDPFEGGLGGGPIGNSLEVSVVDAMTLDGVPQAFVIVDAPPAAPYAGTADDFGEIVISSPDFDGPVSVTAAHAGYENTSIVVFDAAQVTIFLFPLPDPQPGLPPPGRRLGEVDGVIVFGDVTGIGTSTTWDLVPEPRTPTERKRAYVFTTQEDLFTPAPDPGPDAIVDYVGDGRTAWAYAVYARPAALSVVAVAGLYELNGRRFEPHAMGVARGVLVGPDELVRDVPIVIDIPLDTALQVELASPPPIHTPGQPGPTGYAVEAFIDLGGEGVIRLPGSSALFGAEGETGTVVPRMARPISSIADATYALIASAWTGGYAPLSVRIVRGVADPTVPVIVDEFLGVPRPVDPPRGGTASAPHLAFEPQAGPTGEATFTVHLLETLEGAPLWTMVARGDVLDVPLPDLRGAGIPPLPTGPIVWIVYQVTVPGLDFDEWTYRHFGIAYWSAYAADVFLVSIPPYP